jgi:hypothetical protein
MPAIVIFVKREHEFYATDQKGHKCLIPRDTRNGDFALAFGFRTKNIAFSGKYLAFPFVVRLGASLVGIYSEGDAHAASDRQKMIRSDDGGVTWNSVTFYENATGIFDYSLLADLMNDGDKAVFKVWTVAKAGGVFSAVVNSTADYGGTAYDLWSAPRTFGAKLLRTGYATVGGNTQTALFESSDGGVTWTGKALMFAVAGKNFSEADLVNTAGNNWLAICREDTGANNPLFYATSADNGVTWSAPAAYATASINGRQPNLVKLSDGSLILAAGDRSGSSGDGGSGDVVFGADTTGVALWRSTDNGATWSYRTRISSLYSTDGGQPFVNETTAGRIAVAYYARHKIDAEPGIACAMLNVANL